MPNDLTRLENGTEAATTAVPATWDEVGDGLMMSTEVRSLLGGISYKALCRQVSSGAILALRDDVGVSRYPRWQFDAESGSTFAAVERLHEIFSEAGLDPWALAAFSTTPQPELNDRIPAHAFVDEDTELLMRAARRAAAELAR